MKGIVGGKTTGPGPGEVRIHILLDVGIVLYGFGINFLGGFVPGSVHRTVFIEAVVGDVMYVSHGESEREPRMIWMIIVDTMHDVQDLGVLSHHETLRWVGVVMVQYLPLLGLGDGPIRIFEHTAGHGVGDQIEFYVGGVMGRVKR